MVQVKVSEKSFDEDLKISPINPEVYEWFLVFTLLNLEAFEFKNMPYRYLQGSATSH